MSSDILKTPIEYLKGVGPQRADLLKKEIQVFCFEDLLHFYPFRYIDRSRFYTVSEITEDMPYVQIRGYISNIQLHGHRRTTRMTATLTDQKGSSLELIWFNGFKWLKGKFLHDQEYIVFGRPGLFGRKYNIAHPEVEPVSPDAINQKSAMQPVYNSTEKLKSKGLDSRGISKLIKNLIPQVKDYINEILPQYLRDELRLMNIRQALYNVHFPENAHFLARARARLKFDELFYIQLNILRIKHLRTTESHGQIFKNVGEHFNNFYHNNLSFELTGAQKRVVKEIRNDTLSGKQMNRLLQGDVGSGKTIVAVMSMLIALDNGFQACLMAPTEVLANQHYESVTQMLKGLNIEVRLLTGSSKKSERKEIAAKLTDGSLKILIGTHALIEDTVVFQNLGMVVIDEQHRFGVAQRAKLWKKNIIPPHVLVMTATPIPRTLAMTLYGDLDISVIDELPPGRKPIKTIHQYDSNRLKVFGFMRDQIKQGRQIYVVYPLIEESEKLDLKDLQDGYDSIVRAFPLPEYAVSIVHGKMKSQDKDYEMQRFVRGETQIMVATTVIEVGINVPNASVMVIESAERFGLSQLHQLRGRVGRGADQSWCILMTGVKLSNEAKKRIQTMVGTNDGFVIAETDMQLRGPGDMHGTQQSGILDLKIADLSKDEKILKYARQKALEILEKDPDLKLAENKAMAAHVNKLFRHKVVWSKIS
ncbi:MAG: ATP-dependent DNA helicase RecG [Bacteroidetes bacterium]|nr:MAG: ATP-dependent DNA helicase RecG [Bacteroidota bacterium]